MGKSFLFLGANSPWTYGLAEALAVQHHVFAIEFYDWRTYYLLRPSWSSRTPPTSLTQFMQVMPTGYAGQLEKLFRFTLQQRVKQWHQQLERVSNENPWVIVTHPNQTYWVRNVPAERLIYYNFDDYVLYRPSREKKILEQEKELIERAAITLCASHSQTIVFQKRYPHKASRIHHFPHGFVDTYLNLQPEKYSEAMTVGYVGNLGNRLNWQLIYQIVQSCPDIKFVFVGGNESLQKTDQTWQQERDAVLALPNVHNIGKVPPEQVAEYYWSFSINWIPYLVEHPFNKAACPTKIMDGIASGRPILSTDIPECRLYPEWIQLFTTVENACALIHQQMVLSRAETYAKTIQQLDFARHNTWQFRSQTLDNLLLQSY